MVTLIGGYFEVEIGMGVLNERSSKNIIYAKALMINCLEMDRRPKQVISSAAFFFLFSIIFR